MGLDSLGNIPMRFSKSNVEGHLAWVK